MIPLRPTRTRPNQLAQLAGVAEFAEPAEIQARGTTR